MKTKSYTPVDRRPIASRGHPAARRLASAMARRGFSPNLISVSSCVFAVVAAGCLVATRYTDGTALRAVWVLAFVGVQGRLLANLFDGMVAIERNVASPRGELYNEVPDRVSDPLILVGAGYAVGSDPWIGFVAALLAMFVAYVRCVGAMVGAGQDFRGPMAKQHRMFVVSAGCLYAAAVPSAWQPVHAPSGLGVMGFCLAIIVLGCVVTGVRRLTRIADRLRDNC